MTGIANAKKISVLLALFLVIFAIAQTGAASSGDRIQLYYVYNHECLSCEQSWPLVKKTLEDTGVTVDLTKYDINSREGAKFASAHGISSVPAFVFDDGSSILFEQCGDPQSFDSAFQEKLEQRMTYKPPLTLMRNVTREDSTSGTVTIKTFVTCRGDKPLTVNVTGVMPEGSTPVSGSDQWTGLLYPGESHCIDASCQLPRGTRLIPPVTVTYDDGSGLHSILGQETAVIALQELSAIAVYIAGLVAGINPCLLAVMAFIGTTTIADTGHRRVVLWRILGFCGGMLTIYLLIGIGLMGLIQRMPTVDLILRIAIVTVLIALSAWSFLDAWRTKKGSGSTAFKSILDRIRPLYQRFGLIASFATGSIFGLVKMPCVGGIYIAILGTILESGEVARGLSLLVIYNLGVVTPVLLLGTLITVGLSPGTVNQFRLRHRVVLKVITGFLLSCMAVAFMLGIM